MIKVSPKEHDMSSEISMWRRVTVTLGVWFGATFLLLFGGAGTFAWPEAWIYILIQVFSSAVMGLWLWKYNPELLKTRMEVWKRMGKPWDKVVMILVIAAYVPFFFLPGIDAMRFQWSHVALPVKILGFIGILISSGLVFWVLQTNPYSSAAIEVQKERGHTTITTGPYQYVRHPMYAGIILGFFSMPLALGSWVTFIPAIILTVLIMGRTYLEDKTLRQELNGYTTYADTVKFRLIPGVW